MQLDRTFIAIRNRNILELWDLGLQVIRQHFGNLTWALAIGVLPWMILNYVLTGWMVTAENYSDMWGYFIWTNLMLVCSQAQVATCFLSNYLGHAMFTQHPTVSQTVKEVRERGMWFWWQHLMKRLVFPMAVLVGLCAFVSEDDGFLAFMLLFVVPCVAIIGLIVRCWTPYMNEILLLEKAPRNRQRLEVETRIPYDERSRVVHGVAGGDLFLRIIVVTVVGGILAFSFYASLCQLADVLGLGNLTYYGVDHLMIQPAMWLAAGFVAVNRFLSYINLRIQTEGWSVMLKMKAEGARQESETLIG